MADKLRVARAFTLPLGELSGLCVRDLGAGPELLAISDASHVLLRGGLAAGGPTGDFAARDLAAIVGADRGASQWEAIAADASGQLYVLEENPGAVLVLSADLGTCVARIELSVDDDSDARPRGWTADENSRGEGIALLGGGHVLVVKEKRPALLVEFGPSGATSRGVTRDLLLAGAAPSAASGALVPLAAWTVEDAELKDVSDLALGPGGRLFLLSDQSRSIVEVDPLLPAGGGALVALARWQLPKRVSKPEGLAFASDGTPIVVTDDDEGEENLFVLEPFA